MIKIKKSVKINDSRSDFDSFSALQNFRVRKAVKFNCGSLNPLVNALATLNYFSTKYLVKKYNDSTSNFDSFSDFEMTLKSENLSKSDMKSLNSQHKLENFFIC